jgi:hypothetical protein
MVHICCKKSTNDENCRGHVNIYDIHADQNTVHADVGQRISRVDARIVYWWHLFIAAEGVKGRVKIRACGQDRTICQYAKCFTHAIKTFFVTAACELKIKQTTTAL